MVNKNFSVDNTYQIKGVAILMMYVHHMFLSPNRWGACEIDFFPLTEKFTVSIAVFCKLCVSLFVFLTAYGLTKNYRNLYKNGILPVKQIYKFIINRMIKLYLNFWFIFGLVLLYSYVIDLQHYTKIYGKGIKSIYKCLLDGLGLAELFHSSTMCGTWWYMSLAIMLIVLFPIIFYLCDKFGYIIPLLFWLVPVALNLPYSQINNYLPCMSIGILFAQENLLEKGSCYFRDLTSDSSFSKKVLIYLLLAIIIVAICTLRRTLGYKFIPFINMTITPLIILYTYTFLRQKFIGGVLRFLGVHSMNMFLTHTFIRHYWYHDFAYSFGNAWVCVLVLLIITILLSIFIEYLKKITHFNQLLEIKV